MRGWLRTGAREQGHARGGTRSCARGALVLQIRGEGLSDALPRRAGCGGGFPRAPSGCAGAWDDSMCPPRGALCCARPMSTGGALRASSGRSRLRRSTRGNILTPPAGAQKERERWPSQLGSRHTERGYLRARGEGADAACTHSQAARRIGGRGGPRSERNRSRTPASRRPSIRGDARRSVSLSRRLAFFGSPAPPLRVPPRSIRTSCAQRGPRSRGIRRSPAPAEGRWAS